MFYGDFHFHTHYSDNRDRASVEQMIRRGLERGITIFGTGDHNHNLTADNFAAQIAETEEVRRSFPRLVLMNNCEMTFLIGHYLVFDPGKVSGTIEEAYGYLYGANDGALLMANHPGLPSDEWNTRFNAAIAAVEVVNGAVLREARRRGQEASSLLEVPAVGTFVRYLRLGVEVAAVGSSDAHSLDELGSGFTGFHFEGRPDKDAVLTAIRQRTTFASTRLGIDIRWRLAEEHLDWQVDLPESESEGESFSLELYNGDILVERRQNLSSGERGSLGLRAPGLYWLAVVSTRDFAISSPVAFRKSELRIADADRKTEAQALRIASGEKRTLAMEAADLSTRLPKRRVSLAEIRLFGDALEPVLLDPDSRPVETSRIARTEGRRIVDKECEPWQFEEFFTWLERNEIHEYRFASISYGLDRELFSFSGVLIPFRCDKRAAAGSLFAGRVPQIRELVSRARRVRALVALPPTSVLRIESGELDFPLRVVPPLRGTSASLVTEARSDDDAARGIEQFFV